MPSQMSKAKPLPPISSWEMNPPELFPTFQRMKKDADALGTGIHTYLFQAGDEKRRITIVSDTKHYEAIFSPGDYGSSEIGGSLRMDMDRVAHQYFNIHRDVCPHTREGLNGLRSMALNPFDAGKAGGLNDIVGAGIQECMNKLPDSGECNVLDVAEFTFPGVNQALFGKGVVPQGVVDFFYGYDEGVGRATLGLGKDKAYMDAYNKVEQMFVDALEKDVHKGPNAARAMVGRLKPIPEDTDIRQKASFLCSIFWAPQGNTLPMSYWMLAHILSNPEWTARVRVEADKSGLGVNGRYLVDPQDDTCLPFTRACVFETLRIYIANMTLRKADKDFQITMSSGKTYTVPKGDAFMLASYLTHYNEKMFPDPEKFDPLRWLDKNGHLDVKAIPDEEYLPFGKGRFSCSGKHLLLLEMPTLAALFIREFDAEVIDPMPEPDWSYVVASVRPKGWPRNFKNKMKFSRRKKTSKL